jgi:hypothetical protein
MLVGWLAFGTFLAKKDVFLEALLGYERQAIRCGSTNNIDEFGPIPGPEAAPPFAITHAAIWSAQKGGHLLCWFPLLPPFTVTPDPIPRTQFTVFFSSPVTHALNASHHPDYDPLDAEADHLDITRGMVMGTLNGQEMRSGIRLVVYNGIFHARANFKRAAEAAAAA